MAPSFTTKRSTSFSEYLSPRALSSLKQHDDALAYISRSTSDSSVSSSSSSTERANNSVSSEASISSVHREELRKIKNIGSGAFCSVDLVADESHSVFACKSIDPRRVGCSEDLCIATEELANEAKMLSGLDHENIIKLRGVCAERFSESYESGGEGYFLMMDILNETLCDRKREWKKQERKIEQTNKRRAAIRSLRRPFSGSNNTKKRALPQSPASGAGLRERRQRMHDRIRDTVLGIAKGMKYLHSLNIVLRDLKPANIGYENTVVEGGMFFESSVRLFDFGMAKKVDECDPTEICGSPRYMAPEIIKGEGYGLGVDVYSFGITLYEICSLKLPFAETFVYNPSRSRGSKVEDFYACIVNQGLKAASDEFLEKTVPCPKLRDLIGDCWNHDPGTRPTFDEILSRLLWVFHPDLFEDPTQKVVAEPRDDDDEEESEEEETADEAMAADNKNNTKEKNDHRFSPPQTIEFDLASINGTQESYQ